MGETARTLKQPARAFPPERWKDVPVGVIGLGSSGIAAAALLTRWGARLILNDLRPEGERPLLEERLRRSGARWEALVLGEHPESILQRVERLVLSPGVPADLPLLRAARARGIPILGELELAYQATDRPFLAVTGTKGKSTTVTLIGQILAAGGVPATVAGNIGRPVTELVDVERSEGWIVAEVSSFQLESIVQFRPRIGVFLNLSPDHLDRHGTLEAYRAAKLRLTENQTAEDRLVLNRDDPTSAQFAERTPAEVVWFSLEPDDSASAFLRGDVLTVRREDGLVEVGSVRELRVPGRHFVQNVLAALAATASFAVPPERVGAVLRAFTGLPHAYQRLGTFRGVTFVDDSKATNLAAVRAAVSATPPDSPIVLIFGGLDKGNDYRSVLPEIVGRLRAVVLLGAQTSHLEVLFGSWLPTVACRSMEEAVRQAIRFAQPGDTVLLSPGHASFDLFANWKERGNAFQRAVWKLAPRPE